MYALEHPHAFIIGTYIGVVTLLVLTLIGLWAAWQQEQWEAERGQDTKAPTDTDTQ